MKRQISAAIGLACLLFAAACSSESNNPYGTYVNPVLAGDYPDPSIVRDGEDYYMTHSSFDYNSQLCSPGVCRKRLGCGYLDA